MNPRVSDSKTKRVRTVLVSWEKGAVTRSVDNISVFGRGLGGGGGTFWPLNESLTFKSPDA